MSYPYAAPWTGLGSVQADVDSLRRELYSKADSCEISTLRSRLDSVEHTLRELSASVDGLLSRMQEVEARSVIEIGAQR